MAEVYFFHQISPMGIFCIDKMLSICYDTGNFINETADTEVKAELAPNRETGLGWKPVGIANCHNGPLRAWSTEVFFLVFHDV